MAASAPIMHVSADLGFLAAAPAQPSMNSHDDAELPSPRLMTRRADRRRDLYGPECVGPQTYTGYIRVIFSTARRT